MRKLRILYLSCEDPYNKRSWSGIHFNIIRQLNKYFDTTATGPLRTSWKVRFFIRWFNLFLKHVLGRNYNVMHSRLIARDHQKQIRHKMNGSYDLVFSTASSRELSLLDVPTPVLHLSDATFDLIHNTYPGFSNLITYSLHESKKVEKQAIQKASILVYSSWWAARSAIEHYQASSDRIHVVPFGANIQELPVVRLEEKLKSETFHLLFLGVSWIRKGGNIVYDTFIELKRRGLNCQLTICGCIPPFEITEPAITVIPFLDKNKEQDMQTFIKLMQEAHLLFLPTRADGTPIVFCEAAAYGLPVVTTDTGGVSSVVRNGINGYCLNYHAGVQEYADVIQDLFLDKEKYYTLAKQSRELFLNELNWDKWGETVSGIINKHLVKINN